jgi:hypothetical protein
LAATKKAAVKSRTKKAPSTQKGKDFSLAIEISQHVENTDGFVTETGGYRPGAHATSFYEVRINGSQPFFVEGAGLPEKKEDLSDQSKERLDKQSTYFRGNIEEAISYALKCFLYEARIASIQNLNIEEAIDGVDQFWQKALGTVYTANETKSYLHLLLGELALGTVNRIRGLHVGYPKRTTGLRLNVEQLRYCAHRYSLASEQCGKARKEQKTGNTRWKEEAKKLELSDEAIKDLGQWKDGKKQNGHEWRPSEVAYVEAARKAGVKGLKMSHWSTIYKQIKPILYSLNAYETEG